MSNFIEPSIYFNDFVPGTESNKKQFLSNMMQQFPLYPLIYFNEKPSNEKNTSYSNNFEILTAYQEINNDLDRLDKLKNYVLLYDKLYIQGFKNNKKINKSTYGIQDANSLLKFKDISSLPVDPEEFDLSNTKPANDIIESNFCYNKETADKSGKTCKYNIFGGFVDDFDKNNGLFSGYSSKYPLFFKLFDENFEDQEVKKYLRKIFMQYVKLRKKLFESIKKYYGIMAFQYLFDYNLINQQQNAKNSFAKNLNSKYNLGNQSSNEIKKRRNYKNVKMIRYMPNNITNLKNFSEEKSEEHPEVKKNTFKIHESDEMYNNSIPFQSIYSNQMAINTKLLTYIMIYETNLVKDSGNFDVLFRNSFLLDYYSILLCFYFVHPYLYKTFISFDEKIRQNDINKRFSLFNQFMYDFSLWKNKLLKFKVAQTEVQPSIYPKEDQFTTFMEQFFT